MKIVIDLYRDEAEKLAEALDEALYHCYNQETTEENKEYDISDNIKVILD